MTKPKLFATCVLSMTFCGMIGLWVASNQLLLPVQRNDLGTDRFDAHLSPVQYSGRLPASVFIDLVGDDFRARGAAIETIRRSSQLGDAGMLIEAARFTSSGPARGAIFETLQNLSGQNFGADFDRWYQWTWNQPIDPNPDYLRFKRAIYQRLDPRFAEYFPDGAASTIRLDEIRWGGVRRDGIPPLKNPETISAAAANYLADSDIVFGVSFNGQSRAYPKRILAWHEMVKDVVGGRSINGVYCTLCGSMIVYDTQFGGKHYELGTSGFLYRSNKLMYDHETKSMWSTLRGSPVVGSLVGKGIELEPLYVVTTTWGKWKSTHPDTDVLSLRTGHRRDYGEGVAYRDYFSTDELMFTVPKIDRRLKNKDEVLIVRGDEDAIAISAAFLNSHRVYRLTLENKNLLVITDDSGANRVYQSGQERFENDPQQSLDAGIVVSDDGSRWSVTETALVRVDNPSSMMPRSPAHRAFWFGWNAAFPETPLIK